MRTTTTTAQLPDAMILDDRERGIFRVNRDSMRRDDVLQQERERIFSRCWLYVGHASQFRKPGDFIRRTVGGRPIFVAHGDDGVVRCFFNTCTHRGAVVCRHDAGNAKSFQCFYHAWTFGTDGALRGIPESEGYAEGWDKRELGLKEVPRFEQYRGFYFLNYDADAVSLPEYLAGATELLDLIADQSLDGEAKVVEGRQDYSIRANWKLLAENSVDGYHDMPVHATYFAYLMGIGGINTGRPPLSGGKVTPLGNGHAVLEYQAAWGRPVANEAPHFSEEANKEIADIKRQLIERHGEERGRRITEWNRNMVIFPNLVINDIMCVTVRTFEPLQPDLMKVSAWAVAPVEEEGERLQRRLHNFLEFLGPGGFATPDDVEALDSCQIGFTADGVGWNDVSRGMGGAEAAHTSELQMRTFWRMWDARMRGTEVTSWRD